MQNTHSQDCSPTHFNKILNYRKKYVDTETAQRMRKTAERYSTEKTGERLEALL